MVEWVLMVERENSTETVLEREIADREKERQLVAGNDGVIFTFVFLVFAAINLYKSSENFPLFSPFFLGFSPLFLTPSRNSLFFLFPSLCVKLHPLLFFTSFVPPL